MGCLMVLETPSRTRSWVLSLTHKAEMQLLLGFQPGPAAEPSVVYAMHLEPREAIEGEGQGAAVSGLDAGRRQGEHSSSVLFVSLGKPLKVK